MNPRFLGVYSYRKEKGENHGSKQYRNNCLYG